MARGRVARFCTSSRRTLGALSCIAIILAPYATVSPAAARAASSEQKKVYDFRRPSDYSYDPRVVLVGGGKASLRALPLDTGWWKKTYSWGSDSGVATGVATDAQGNVFTSGYFSYESKYGIWLKKVDARSGNTLWSKTYIEYSSCRSFDADTDPSGNLIVCGDAGNLAFIAKYSGASGNLLWEKRFSYGSFYQTATGIACYPNGDVLVAGWYYDGGMRAVMWVAKLLGSNGKRVWHTTEASPGTDLMPGGAECDPAGNAYVSGSVWRPGSNNIIARKYSPACTPVWAREYDFGPQEQGYDISVDPQGNPCIAASIVIPSGSMTASLIKLLAPTGDVSWRTTFEPYTNSNTFGKGVSFDSRGEVFLTGLTYDPAKLYSEAYLAKYDSRGTLLWSRSHYATDRHWLGERVATDAFGNAALCGYTDLSNLRSGLLISSPPGRYTPYPQPVTPKACVDLKDRDALSFKAELFSSRTPPRFQLSPDNANWLYHGNDGWKPASSPENANTAEVVSKHIVEFNAIAQDALFVRVLLTTDGQSTCYTGRLEVTWAPSVTCWDWLLADGSTLPAFGFEEYVLILNPNSCEVMVDIYCYEKTGPTGPLLMGTSDEFYYPGHKLRIDPFSRATIHVDHFRPNTDELSLALFAEDKGGHHRDIVVERTMYHGNSDTGKTRESGAIAVGTTKTYPTWYFAEGSTANGFETYVLLYNQNDADVIADVTFMFEEGAGNKAITVDLTPYSRKTIIAANEVGSVVGFSTRVDVRTKDSEGNLYGIACERSMFAPGRAAFDANLGSPVLSKKWYFAEGSTGPIFKTWLLLQNPQAETANVEITCMPDEGQPVSKKIAIGAMQRKTVDLSTIIDNKWGVAARVESDRDVVCERAMYASDYSFSHTTTGVPDPLKKYYYFAEGCTAVGFEEWLLLMNPTNSHAKVGITLVTPRGPVYSGGYEHLVRMGPHSRKTILLNTAWSQIAADKEISLKVRAYGDSRVVVERSMFWDAKQGGSVSTGHQSDGDIGEFYELKAFSVVESTSPSSGSD